MFYRAIAVYVTSVNKARLIRSAWKYQKWINCTELLKVYMYVIWYERNTSKHLLPILYSFQIFWEFMD